MRILHLAKYYPPTKGGMETHISTLCEELSSQGHDVTCYAFGQVKENTKGVNVKIFKSLFKTPPFSPALLWTLLTNRNKFDIVHVHMPNPWVELCALIAKPKKLVASYHSDIIGKRGASLYLPFQRILLRRANAIISASKQYSQTSDQLRRFHSKITLIPYGITPLAISDTQLVKEIRSRSKGPIYLFVGRLVHYKGVRYLIEAMGSTDGTLIIVGDGPLKKELADLVRSLKLSDKIVFAQNVTDEQLPSFYEACDVFILPSINRAEGFGIVQLEAMMRAKPVISTRLGTGTDEINIHGKTGLTVEPENPKQLSDAMNTLDRDPLLRIALGKEAKKNASKYSASRMTRDILAIYRTI
ncbi:glycosyltransferase [Candidatus Woesearchaeota archaeon]|nr:glycosyltransferase [Candidatus Woesearchaeota archaeon]